MLAKKSKDYPEIPDEELNPIVEAILIFFTPLFFIILYLLGAFK